MTREKERRKRAREQENEIKESDRQHYDRETVKEIKSWNGRGREVGGGSSGSCLLCLF